MVQGQTILADIFEAVCMIVYLSGCVCVCECDRADCGVEG